MNVGDLVILKENLFISRYSQPQKELGIIIEKNNSPTYGLTFFVFTIDGIIRFADYELELLNGKK